MDERIKRTKDKLRVFMTQSAEKGGGRQWKESVEQKRLGLNVLTAARSKHTRYDGAHVPTVRCGGIAWDVKKEMNCTNRVIMELVHVLAKKQKKTNKNPRKMGILENRALW